MTSYAKGKVLAQSLQRPLMIDFTADWCVACQKMDAEVFRHPRIRSRLESEFIVVKVDIDERTPVTQEAIQRFEVAGLPRVAFETADGEFFREASFEGGVGIEEFDRRLDQVLEAVDTEPADG